MLSIESSVLMEQWNIWHILGINNELHNEIIFQKNSFIRKYFKFFFSFPEEWYHTRDLIQKSVEVGMG